MQSDNNHYLSQCWPCIGQQAKNRCKDPSTAWTTKRVFGYQLHNRMSTANYNSEEPKSLKQWHISDPIGVSTKWPQHFQMHFLAWKLSYLYSNFPKVGSQWSKWKLEQLERLRFEIPHTAPWLPILVIHIRSQLKTRQSQSYKFKKSCQKFKFRNFARQFTHAKPSELAL